MVHISRLPIASSPLLVHYVGDSSTYQPLPHKSALKTKDREFIRSAPTIAAHAKANMEKAPQQVYEEILCAPKAFQPAYDPRDRKQIENFHYAERTKNRLSQDALYNLYALGFEYSDFILEYRADFAAENNVVYLANRSLLEKLNELLKPPADVSENTVEVFYDTTFQLGRFFVSVFCYHHYMLDGRPTVPAAFMIHQRKFSCDHTVFLASLMKICPNLVSTRFAFVTDREFQDVSSTFPKAQHLYCWTHIRRDVRFWTTQSNHRLPEFQRRGEGGTYSQDIFRLLKSKDLEEFERTVGDLQTLWAPAFIKYFNNHLKCDMTTKACKWVVESIGLYNEWSGITTNAVESINAVISQSFSTPAKIDEAVLILHHLTGYYNYEVDRGLCNVGKYHLANGFAEYKKDISDIQNDNVFPLEVIVDKVKKKLSELNTCHSTKATNANKSMDAGAADPLVDDSSSCALTNMTAKNPVSNDKCATEKLEQRACTSQITSAKLLCEQKKVTLVSERSVFVVEGGRD